MEKKNPLEKKLCYERKLAWDEFSPESRKKTLEFAEGYKEFLTRGKTEWEVITEGTKMAEKAGFIPLEKIKKGSFKGKRVYADNRGKNLFLSVLGKKPISEGVRIIIAHIDSPRLDLKAHPVYEEENLAFFKTHYYGGIKKYQWVTIPLALHGVVVLKNGKKINLVIGEKKEEPVFTITDLLPHLASDQMKKSLEKGIEGEALNILAGSIPHQNKDVKERIKLAILEKLNQKYNFTEEDLVSSNIEAVPAGEARDAGLDKSLIAAYGQDDRVCVYSSLKAICELKNPETTCFCMLVDKEEIGSEGVNSAQSTSLLSFLSEILNLSSPKATELQLRRILSSSQAISADVNAGVDPAYKDVNELRNSPRIGCGVVLTKFTGKGGKGGSSEASSEFVAYLRNLFEKRKVIWQTGELGKIDQGGGGTVAKYLARYNCEVIDCGTALLSMHAPLEIAHKADIYSTYQAYSAFYK
ncbi:MAG: aminopeptidase [bacterium (Candidatus Ratteibacteria) CG_4_10_14_3_um_filter_41_18]|uniref:M18 family aminopeptidase n=4 Tax=Candidatus Ratteibacteria TaxID=2979319 RepID=A0A2M7YHP0_9BACT|nr:MAG: aminopeptidase [Candidatus Omnitrophica bacterium CG1_02_41_171]PIV64324.1 MAG: aminopeptidase [bacterium (Candidatus Ratteibacteria) CG01_land_8_20_14_3_00_40_19]PIW30544.1 MAG: aminopeptidase [bacterium (Candidatus Ratteibacteria) CG15_BIG_FIL_POST_REV_8_21_14_020_41_12]PIW73999.1 MAG: aminopeptidase [bacterium (Candidatus Ratteibacteria) CG_4_8_14_3_um_filter_41_36]PIX77749.1 MAG: aminopeptidase [bacterium (Candidatus Ratteibacteria) CG_4_10_14_3_um_filter_41_18]PJA62497.1 MAG: amin